MLRDELQEILEPIVAKVTAHPFWTGLREGTLPPKVLHYYVQQDAGYLLPAYARALAICAGRAANPAHRRVFAHSVGGTLDARDRLTNNYGSLAERLGAPPDDFAAFPPVDPGTHAHASFFVAAAATSTAAGMGALLPMVLFNHRVSNDLRDRQTPDGRYAPWIEAYHPGERYEFAVRGFTATAEQVAAEGTAAERDQLIEHFVLGSRYEWLFADTVYNQPAWPV